MQTRLLWRRSATAIGLYGSVALGLLGGLVAARELHRAGLRVAFVSGVGYAVSPPPGTLVNEGTLVRVARQ